MPDEGIKCLSLPKTTNIERLAADTDEPMLPK